MKKGFDLSIIEEIKLFIGLKISLLKTNIYISNLNYVKKVLKRFGTQDAKLLDTPMVKHCNLSKDDESYLVDATL